MDINNVLESIKKFLELDGWTYFHLKADSPSGQRREMFVTNVPLVTEAPESQVVSEPTTESPVIIEAQPIEETGEEQFRRIYGAILQDQMPEGGDLEWWKNLQMSLSMGGQKPQVNRGEPMEEAVTKVKEAGLI